MVKLDCIYNEDCLQGLKKVQSNSVDAVITDPPYGLSFMGKKWDYNVPSVEIWEECLRVLKPGGYLLSFGGTRTCHRITCAVEDAGFEIRDMIMWVYGSGFPKSLNIGKAVDKLQGNKREVVDRKDVGHDITSNAYKDAKPERKIMNITKGTSEWEGWGTALKPALEPITVARKPLSEKTVALNVLRWGTGGINIDECRVEFEDTPDPATNPRYRLEKNYKQPPKGKNSGLRMFTSSVNQQNTNGRFPANLIHDGSDEVVGLFPQSAGQQGNVRGTEKSHTGDENTNCYGEFNRIATQKRGDSGTASRFFYVAKSDKGERNKGMKGTSIHNNHPTVKPINLMEYLIKLVTIEDAVILDPFVGSGTTAVACKRLNRRFIGFEVDKKYYDISLKRLLNVPERLESFIA